MREEELNEFIRLSLKLYFQYMNEKRVDLATMILKTSKAVVQYDTAVKEFTN